MGQEASGETGAQEVPSQYEKELCTASVSEHWNSLPREPVESSSSGIFKPHLDTILCSLLWVNLLKEKVGHDGLQKVLPTPAIL